MTLVMAMSVEYLAVAKGISSPLTLWDKMIDFPDISILEDESTVAAFPLLIFKKPRQLPFNQRMMLESLAPIPKLSVVWVGFTPYLHMVGDRCLAV